MIKAFNLSQNTEIKFEITIFPDKTSQVWKMSPVPASLDLVEVTWDFENEAELFHVIQLGHLIVETTSRLPELSMPYLVCGRQDKAVSNNSTFSRQTLFLVLKEFYSKITTVDAHSSDKNIVSINPSHRIKEILKSTEANLVCFPDKGASNRGYNIGEIGVVCLEKDRDQSTGEIRGLKFAHFGGKESVKNGKILIVDDLCDGGRTFTESAKLLKSAGANQVYLYTTHGIYSKGKEILFSNGLDKVFNYKEEVKSDLDA